MPISQINPDGTVKIYNKNTGETRDVKPEELGTYNPSLIGDYQKQRAQLDLARSGNLDVNKLAESDPIAAQTAIGMGAKGAPTKEDQAKKVKSDIIDVAKNLQDVIANKSKYDTKTYKDTINALSSSIVLKKKEADNLGAALSGNELGILSGQVPVVQTIGSSLLQKAGALVTGRLPVQHGEVVDDDATLQNKMKLLIAGLEGKPITPEMFALAKHTAPIDPVTGKPKLTLQENNQKGLDAFKKVLKGASNIANDLGAGISANQTEGARNKANADAEKTAHQLEVQAMATDDMAKRKALLQQANVIRAQISQGAQEVSGTFSKDVTKNPVLRGLEGGTEIATTADLVANPGQILEGFKAGANVLMHPIQSAQALGNVVKNPGAVLPAVKAFLKEDLANSGKMTGTNIVATAPEIANEVTPKTNKLPVIVPNGTAPLGDDIAGRTGTVIAFPGTGQILKDEKLITDAIKETNGITRRSMGRQLEARIEPIGENITKYAQQLDETIGGQPVDNVLGEIEINLADNSPIQANEREYQMVKDMVKKKLAGGFMQNGQEVTTVSKINEARIALNKSIPSSWFKNGMPTSSTTDVLNAIKWDYSNQLMDMMAQADPSGWLKRAVELQHTSYQVAPALYAKVVAGEKDANSLLGMVRSAWDKVTVAPKIKAIRSMQGEIDPLTQQILNGELPPITSKEIPESIIPNAPIVENAPNNLPPVSSGTGPSTVVGTGEHLGGQSLVNTKKIREVIGTKGKTILQMQDSNGKWVEYSPSQKNFKKTK